MNQSIFKQQQYPAISRKQAVVAFNLSFSTTVKSFYVGVT